MLISLKAGALGTLRLHDAEAKTDLPHLSKVSTSLVPPKSSSWIREYPASTVGPFSLIIRILVFVAGGGKRQQSSSRAQA